MAQAERALEAARQQVREANAAMVKAKQDEEALIKHREKWEKEQQVIQRRREEDEADDIAQTSGAVKVRPWWLLVWTLVVVAVSGSRRSRLQRQWARRQSRAQPSRALRSRRAPAGSFDQR